MLSPWIAAIIGMATAQASHDIQYATAHDAPWDGHGDNKWDWGDFLKGQTKAGTIGGTLGYAGGYAGGALGAAAGSADGAVAGGATGAAVGDAAGALGGEAAGMTLAEGATGIGDILGANIGTVAADAGAATPTGIAGIVPHETANILQAAETGSKPLLQETLKRAALNAGSGALQDTRNPVRGAVTGAVGSFASGAVNALGNGLGSALSGPGATPNTMGGPTHGFTLNNPSGDFSARPITTGYSLSGTNATPAPTLTASLGNQAVGLGSRFAGRAASGMVGSALTPTPTTYDPNPYAQYGIQPYWARSRF